MTDSGLGDDTVLEHAELAWREVAGETVILDQAGNKIFGLNGTGGEVWKLIDGKRSLKEIAAELAEGHRIAPDRARDDVFAFASMLVDRKLVGAAA